MNTMKLFLATALLLGVVSVVWGQDTLYTEYFTDGTTSLNWFTPWTGGDNMVVGYLEGNPSGDNWVGLISNVQSGGGVGTTLAGELTMTDYEVQAQIYCTVNTGTYHAIIARWDTTDGNSYYYFRSDLDSDQRLQLRKYPGASGFGETIAEWVGNDIPGGVPTQDSWHHMALKCEGNQLWVYWNGVELTGSPFTDDYLSAGFFGLYVFNFMGTALTYCDDIIVLGEAGPQPFDFIAQANHYLNDNLEEMTLRPAENQIISFRLDWDAINGSTTSPAFDITLEIDDVEIFRENNPGVEPNTSHQTQSNPWTAILGEHSLRWTLDVNYTVPESNENNNVLVDTFLVLPVTAFDFQVDSSWVADSDTMLYEDTVEVNDEVLFVLNWSVPMGSGASGAFNITVELDGEDYYLETIMGVQSDSNYVTVTHPWPATEGFHYYIWRLDADDWVDEFNENNNFIMDGFDVNPVSSVPQDGRSVSLLPGDTRLTNVYPNPFNPAVTLRYQHAQPGKLKLVIFDTTGREVAVLIDGFIPQGSGELTWEAEDLAAGIYFAVLTGGGYRSVQPLLFVK